MGEILVMIGGLAIGIGVLLIINKTKKVTIVEKRGKYEDEHEISG